MSSCDWKIALITNDILFIILNSFVQMYILFRWLFIIYKPMPNLVLVFAFLVLFVLCLNTSLLLDNKSCQLLFCWHHEQVKHLVFVYQIEQFRIVLHIWYKEAINNLFVSFGLLLRTIYPHSGSDPSLDSAYSGSFIAPGCPLACGSHQFVYTSNGTW